MPLLTELFACGAIGDLSKSKESASGDVTHFCFLKGQIVRPSFEIMRA
jgi:hypothetical protein